MTSIPPVKKLIYLVALILTSHHNTSGQIFCIHCFNQNDSISFGVNNLISNGGFESGGCLPSWNFCPNSDDYNCDITNWICTGGGAFTYSILIDTNTSIIVDGNYAAFLGNGHSWVCSGIQGDTSCLNDSLCMVTGIPAGYPYNINAYGGLTGVSLQQNVNGLSVGHPYVLEFWAGGKRGYSYLHRNLFAVDLGFGKIWLRNNSTPPDSGIGTRYFIEFIAIDTVHTIQFTSWGVNCDTCTELVLDDVKLYTLNDLPVIVPDCITDFSDLSNNETLISIFPNPNHGSFTVNNLSALESTTISISNMLSEILYTENLSGMSEYVIHSSLSAGIYLVSLNNSQIHVTQKLLIIK
jgi:hypothetical protein